MSRQARISPEQWTDPRHIRGLRGERAARAYLESRGWRIEAHRFKLGRHDLDLVARRGSLVAFVEVKTRATRSCGAPVEAVGPRKQRILARVAECWRLRHGRPEDRYRFDVVAVVEGPIGQAVEHVADAWRILR
ncbi:MAG TPA: YraN family protein [Gemmatimonadales bacterium]|nr:YraN family protein [Gemmatimonadales bacterium]